MGSPNLAGCIELKDPGNGVACATKVQQSTACEHKACDSVCPLDSTQTQASFNNWVQCVNAADQGVCQTYADAASACTNNEQTGPAASCFPSTNDFAHSFPIYASLFCGGAAPDGADGG
jgi:hypothetical protein